MVVVHRFLQQKIMIVRQAHRIGEGRRGPGRREEGGRGGRRQAGGLVPSLAGAGPQRQTSRETSCDRSLSPRLVRRCACVSKTAKSSGLRESTEFLLAYGACSGGILLRSDMSGGKTVIQHPASSIASIPFFFFPLSQREPRLKGCRKSNSPGRRDAPGHGATALLAGPVRALVVSAAPSRLRSRAGKSDAVQWFIRSEMGIVNYGSLQITRA